MSRDTLVLGARRSRLALASAVAEVLRAGGAATTVELIPEPAEASDLAADDALAPMTRGAVDLLVLGGEELPVEDPAGYGILAVIPRAERGDSLIVRPDLVDSAAIRLLGMLESIDPRDPFLALPTAPRLVVGSALAAAMLQWLRADVLITTADAEPDELLRWMDDGIFDATIAPVESLRAAGRLGDAGNPLPAPWLTAPGRGALIVVGPWESPLREALLSIEDRGARLELIAERTLAGIVASWGALACGVEARCRQARLDLSARVFPADGGPPVHATRSGEGSAQGALRLASIVARELDEAGGSRWGGVGPTDS